jgi:hypothetical protein
VGFDFEVMDRLFQKGYMYDPRGKAKSVVLTREGLARSERLLAEMCKKSWPRLYPLKGMKSNLIRQVALYLYTSS